MQRTLSCLCRVIIVLLWANGCQAAPKTNPRVDVVLGGDPPELERFAARDLCDYLAKLFNVQTYPNRNPSDSADIVFLVGSPETNALVKQATQHKAFPKVSDQGIVLLRMELAGHPAPIVGGGSPRATLWAVYELVERWGVRYLVDRDMLPQQIGAFKIPNLESSWSRFFARGRIPVSKTTHQAAAIAR
jgi:hypothetical protein